MPQSLNDIFIALAIIKSNLKTIDYYNTDLRRMEIVRDQLFKILQCLGHVALQKEYCLDSKNLLFLSKLFYLRIIQELTWSSAGERQESMENSTTVWKQF